MTSPSGRPVFGADGIASGSARSSTRIRADCRFSLEITSNGSRAPETGSLGASAARITSGTRVRARYCRIRWIARSVCWNTWTAGNASASDALIHSSTGSDGSTTTTGGGSAGRRGAGAGVGADSIAGASTTAGATTGVGGGVASGSWVVSVSSTARGASAIGASSGSSITSATSASSASSLSARSASDSAGAMTSSSESPSSDVAAPASSVDCAAAWRRSSAMRVPSSARNCGLMPGSTNRSSPSAGVSERTSKLNSPLSQVNMSKIVDSMFAARSWSSDSSSTSPRSTSTAASGRPTSRASRQAVSSASFSIVSDCDRSSHRFAGPPLTKTARSRPSSNRTCPSPRSARSRRSPDFPDRLMIWRMSPRPRSSRLPTRLMNTPTADSAVDCIGDPGADLTPAPLRESERAGASRPRPRTPRGRTARRSTRTHRAPLTMRRARP